MRRPGCHRVHAPCSCCTMSRAIRTRRSPSDWGSPRAVRSHNCSKRAQSSAHCSRIWLIDPCGRTWNMSHLSTERLAALVDEQPNADEKAHLTHCADCARELDAHRSVFAMAGSERDAMQLPLTRWETLSQ